MCSVNPVDPIAVNPIHGLWTYSMGLFFRKIIQIIPKITGIWNFAKTPTNFFKIMF
jgi:hypothetical protein